MPEGVQGLGLGFPRHRPDVPGLLGLRGGRPMTEIVTGTLLLTLIVLALTLAVQTARRLLSPMYPVTVTVNGTERIATTTGEKLLGALNDNGVLVPSACAGAGTCGLCRVKVTEGGAPALPTETARLSRVELRDGMHLACQVVLRGDMGVEVPEALLGAESFETTVVLDPAPDAADPRDRAGAARRDAPRDRCGILRSGHCTGLHASLRRP